jgi:hypothetical protein
LLIFIVLIVQRFTKKRVLLTQNKKRKRTIRLSKIKYEEKVVQVKRVTKVVKGGKKMTFRAIVIIGDTKRKVGVGIGRADDVNLAGVVEVAAETAAQQTTLTDAQLLALIQSEPEGPIRALMDKKEEEKKDEKEGGGNKNLYFDKTKFFGRERMIFGDAIFIKDIFDKNKCIISSIFY